MECTRAEPEGDLDGSQCMTYDEIVLGQNYTAKVVRIFMLNMLNCLKCRFYVYNQEALLIQYELSYAWINLHQKLLAAPECN